MTAEVGVMNTMGVALAADSAVTVRGKAEKIHISAEKLFQLSDSAPVGAMLYGNAFFVGLPWETIVKSYRRHLGDTLFETVREYAEHLLSWIGENRDLFPDEVRERQIFSLLLSYFLFIRDEIKERINREAERQDGLNESDLPAILDQVVKESLERVRSSPLLKTLPTDSHKLLRKEFRSALARIKTQVFGQLPFKPSTKRLLNTLAVELLARHYFGPFQCGLVVAGYGEKQYMPALVSYEVEEMVCSKPRCVMINDYVIEGPAEAVIIPFGQKDVVRAFMEGIDERVHGFMVESTSEVFKGALEFLIGTVKRADERLGDTLSTAIDPNVESMLSELFDAWQNYRRDYWGPVLNVMSSLPKDGLAEIAEALVNLTKFRRQVTDVPETVGGPVDVAVITKGDGFVWMRRKHYFEASLNPRFIARYYKRRNGYD